MLRLGFGDPRDLECNAGQASGRAAASDQEEAVDVDSNASFAGEVERNVSQDNDFSLRGKLHQVRGDPGRLLASLRGRRACISASSMSGAGGRSQTDNPSLTKRLHYRLCYASGMVGARGIEPTMDGLKDRYSAIE